MSAKVVWVAMGLTDLLWVGGGAVVWLAGTPKLRLSVAPGRHASRVRKREEPWQPGRAGWSGGMGRMGQEEDHYPITRRASGRRGRRVGRQRLEGARAPFGEHLNHRKCGKRAGVPPFFLKRGESAVRGALVAQRPAGGLTATWGCSSVSGVGH